MQSVRSGVTVRAIHRCSVVRFRIAAVAGVRAALRSSRVSASVLLWCRRDHCGSIWQPRSGTVSTSRPGGSTIRRQPSLAAPGPYPLLKVDGGPNRAVATRRRGGGAMSRSLYRLHRPSIRHWTSCAGVVPAGSGCPFASYTEWCELAPIRVMLGLSATSLGTGSREPPHATRSLLGVWPDVRCVSVEQGHRSKARAPLLQLRPRERGGGRAYICPYVV